MEGVFVGLATLDVIHRVARLPLQNEKMDAQWQDLAAGGPAAVAAKAYAALGGDATLITAIGNRKTGRMVRRDLEDAGVLVIDIAAEERFEAPLASVFINSESGERAIVSSASLPYQLQVPTKLKKLISGAETVLVDGHHAPLAIAAANAAQESGIPLIVDGGRWKRVFSEILPKAQVAIVSEDFGLVEGEALDVDVLLSLGLSALAVTRGADSVKWWQRNGETGKVFPPPTIVKNTLGAGDVLHGAYCYFHNYGFVPALTTAVQISSECCQFDGVPQWLANLNQREDSGDPISELSYWNQAG